jgi:hypothetical protein
VNGVVDRESKPADAIADWQDGTDTFYARKGTADELPLFGDDVDDRDFISCPVFEGECVLQSACLLRKAVA